jgi:hypothetical protein
VYIRLTDWETIDMTYLDGTSVNGANIERKW